MAESQGMGGIHYDVAMDVKPMLSGERQVGSSLDRMEGNFNKAAKSIDGAEKSMLSFSKAALAVTSAISVGAVVSMVDEWGQVAARIKMALKSVEGDIEKYGEIQERFLEISNRNGKAIEDTQLLYVGAATSMQELGYSTEQTVDYIESLSSSLTANAASANETQSMINALNKSMVSGKVAGENWNSIMNATPTLIGDIAKQLSIMRGGVKVTEQEVKKLAADGKISFQLFADAVIKAKEANNAMADSMDNTVADGFTKLTNSAKAYFGELNQSLGITREISAGFAVLSNNFDKVAAAAVIASAVIGSRMVGAMAESIKTKISDIAASNNQAQATLQAARADQYAATTAVKKSLADKGSTASAVALAQAEYNVAKGSAAEATALENLIAKKTAARNASLAHAQALKIESASILATGNAARAASTGLGALRAGLALIGGPMGAAMLAAGAIFYFYQKSQEAKQEALAFADSIEELKNKMKEMSDVALMGNIAEASKSIDVQKESIKDLQGELEVLQSNYSFTANKTAEFQGRSENLVKIQRDIAIKTKEIEEAQNKLAKTTKYVSDATGELADRNKDLYDAMNSASGMAGKMGAAIGALQQRIKAAADEKNRLNNKMKESPETDDGKKYIQNLKDQNELLNIQDKKKRAIKKAEIEAGKITENTGQIDAAKKLAEENYNLLEAEREREKQSKSSTKTSDDATKSLKRQLDEIERLNKGYEEGSKQLAQYDASKALGDKASPKQIAEAERLAGELYDIQQRLTDKRAALEANVIAKAEKLKTDELAQIERQLKAGDISFEESQRRRLEIASEYATKIAEATANNIITPVAENRAKFDPIQALANENTRKLAMMKEYYDQERKLLSDSYAAQQITHEQFTAAKSATDMQYHMLLTAMDKQYQEQQTAAQWELMRNQSLSYEMMASAVDSFAGNASNVITGLMTGTMSAADAMRSLGNTMLNSVVNSLVQVGVEMLKNFIIGQTIGNAAAGASAAQATLVATAWAPAAALSSLATMGANAAAANSAIVGTVGVAKGMAIAGARYNGGPVGAGQMYQVGEHGKPEIFKASTGKQYMIPGDNGRVISNKDMQGGGKGLNVNVVFNDYSSGGHQFEAQASQNGDTLTVQAFLTDMHEKGPMHRSITQNTTATTRL
ncbi:tape measure protein [Moellerella wisconsensis]|uniref:tape measure protein n=1 Tax=Moellerella wisconsensis TaxID=158849 RepID=UPI0024107E60|nr:tape measure protein [Moellerella wisconsensis]